MVRRGLRFESGRGLCEEPANRRFFCRRRLQDLQYSVRVETFMEPSGSERTLQSVGNGRIRLRGVRVGRTVEMRTASGLFRRLAPRPESVFLTIEHMTLQRMEHVGIVVDDLAAATEFFVELGLVLQGEGPSKVAGSTASWRSRAYASTLR
jgi:hypothetical protein